MPEIVIPPTFKRRMKRKPPALQAAIKECLSRLAEDPSHPGLHTHKVRGVSGVFEAYIDQANRITFGYDGAGRIELRNNCNHDMLLRNP